MMADSILALPISLKQIAALIKRMSQEDRQQLLTLVPELRHDAMRTKRKVEDARQTVQALKQEVLQAIGGQLFSPDEPFLDGLTLGEYLSLRDVEQAKLWDKWTEMDRDDLEEVEVSPNAMPAR